MGVDEPIGVFRLPIDPKSISKPAKTTFDLVIGRDARADAVILCNLPQEDLIQAIPSNSLRTILEPYTEVIQAVQFSD